MSSELRATLAISKSEALMGTSRTLTLPGGRKVTVNVPAGAYDGQVIRVEDAANTLLLSLSIMQAEGSAFATGPNSDDLTVAASNPYSQTPSGSIPNPYLQNTPVHAQYPYAQSATPPPPSFYPQNQGRPAFPPASSKGAASRLLSPRNIVLAGLVLLLVVAGVVGAAIFIRNNPAGTLPLLLLSSPRILTLIHPTGGHWYFQIRCAWIAATTAGIEEEPAFSNVMAITPVSPAQISSMIVSTRRPPSVISLTR